MEDEQKGNKELKLFIIFILIFAAIAAAVWFFGWRAERKDITKPEGTKIINVQP